MKKSNFLSLISAIVLSSCGEYYVSGSNRADYVDKYLEQYVEEFEDAYGASIGDVRVHFGGLSGPQVGYCSIETYASSELRYVTIDPKYWFSAEEEQKINLIFHELGHCVLNRDHTDDRFYYDELNVHVPSSFMFPINFLNWSMRDLIDYYKNEMFYPETRRN